MLPQPCLPIPPTDIQLLGVCDSKLPICVNVSLSLCFFLHQAADLSRVYPTFLPVVPWTGCGQINRNVTISSGLKQKWTSAVISAQLKNCISDGMWCISGYEIGNLRIWKGTIGFRTTYAPIYQQKDHRITSFSMNAFCISA